MIAGTIAFDFFIPNANINANVNVNAVVPIFDLRLLLPVCFNVAEKRLNVVFFEASHDRYAIHDVIVCHDHGAV